MSRTDAIIRPQPIRFFDGFDTELFEFIDLSQYSVLYKTTDNIEFQTNNVDEMWFNQLFSNNLFTSGLTNWSQYNAGTLPAWSTGTCSGTTDSTASITKTAGQASQTLYQQISLELGKWYRISIDICDLTGVGVSQFSWSNDGSLGGFTVLSTFNIQSESTQMEYFQWAEASGDYDLGFVITGTGSVTALELSRIRLQTVDMRYIECTTETAVDLDAETLDDDIITFSLSAVLLNPDIPYYFQSNSVAGLGKSIQFMATASTFFQMQFNHTGDGVFGIKWSDLTDSTLLMGFKRLNIGQNTFENENAEVYQNSSEQNRTLYSQINKKVKISVDVVPFYVLDVLAYLTNVNNFQIDVNGDARRYVKIPDDFAPNWQGYEQASISFDCYEAEQSTGIVKNSANL